MKRIKDLEKIILKDTEVLMEVFFEESLILKPDSTKDKDFDHAVVIAVGKEVKDLVKGDIILQGIGGVMYKIKKEGEKEMQISIMPRHGIVVATHPDNIDLSEGKRKINKLLN